MRPETLKDLPSEITVRLSSPDNHRVVIGTYDGTIYVFESVTGRRLYTLKGHARPVADIALAWQGRLAISRAQDTGYWHEVDPPRVWDLFGGECLHVLKGHMRSVTALAVTRNGKYALTGSTDYTLRLWDLATGRCVRSFGQYNPDMKANMYLPVEAIALTPDDRYVIAAYDEGAGREGEPRTLRIWDIETGNHVASLEHDSRHIISVGVMPDGRRVTAVGDDGTHYEWDLETQ